MSVNNTSELSAGHIYLPVEAEIVKWKVEIGTIVYNGRILLMYKEKDKQTISKLKSTKTGKILKCLVAEGDIVKPEFPLLELELGCSHPTIINELCAECGADLQAEENNKQERTLFSMVHSVPQLKVNEEQAQILGKADEARLLKDRKLVLLVDLDQTLIHTTNDNIPNNFKDVHHFQLYGPRSPWYHTRLRPSTKEFLSRISKMYELHICTFGSRNYAHMIAHLLDPDGKYFSHRILSRDECFDPCSKTANLKALFPCGEDLVCIIDDREDVWEYAPNLINVKPYHFFQHTGDIHAPPELTKCENDELFNSEFIHLAQGITAKKRIRQEDSDKRKESETCALVGGDQVSSEPIFKRCQRRKSDNTKKEDQIDSIDDKDKQHSSEDTAVTGNNNNNNNITAGDNNIRADDSCNGNENICHIVDTIMQQESKIDTRWKNTMDNNSTAEIIDAIDNRDNNEVLLVENEDNEAATKDSVSISNTETSGNETQNDKSTDDDSDEVRKAIAKVAELAQMLKNVQKDNNARTNSLLKSSNDNNILGVNDKESTKDDNRNNNNNNDEPSSSSITNDNNLSAPEITGDSLEIGGHLVKVEWNSTPLVEEMIELIEQDDYLLHLEKILTNIHKRFFIEYDRCERMPNLKSIIPNMRSNILMGVNLVFSGVVPGHVKLHDTRAYKVAISIGAKVSQTIETDTTHLVATRMGTAKVHTAQRRRDIKIVTPEWLWMSAERWTKSDESLYPIKKARISSRHPPAHCSSPERTPPGSPPPMMMMTATMIHQHHRSTASSTSAITTTTTTGDQSDKFIDTIHPLMLFSMEDITKMSDEVEHICEESESDSLDDEDRNSKKQQQQQIICKSIGAAKKHLYRHESDQYSSTSTDSFDDQPSYKKHKYFRKSDERYSKRRKNYDNESLNEKFRRGEALPSDLDLGISEEDSEDNVVGGLQTDNECDIMAAAIEQAFQDDY